MHTLLEAIQKGLKLGLEIQDDDQQAVFQKSSITANHHVNRANQIRWIRENFVDLGLPSGTLWCKYNLGATCEDTPQSWYGNYYAWGETVPKKEYSFATYKHANWQTYNKYADTDQLTTLEPEDDAVNVTLGKDFRMPSRKDFEELCSLPSKWVFDYNGIKGLNGRVFAGTNGKTLFIPAAGHHEFFYHNGETEIGTLWTNHLYSYNSFGDAS